MTQEGAQRETAVVTGAAGGIGLGIARACAGAGMQIVVADIDGERLNAAARDLEQLGADVRAVPSDVRDEASLESLRDQTLSAFGAVHQLYLNAGGPLPRATTDVTDHDWARVLELNLYSVVRGVRVFLPTMTKQGRGHICATASMSGLVPRPPVVTYNAAKAAVIAYMETLAQELAEGGSPIGLSVLCPGEVATQGVAQAMGHAQAEGYEPTADELATVARAQIGLGRGGIDPDEAGRIAVEGVREGRFWIFTHRGWVSGPLSDRYRAMMSHSP